MPTIQRMVEEEGTYKLENVMVGNAKFTKVNASNVPRNVFEFMSFKDILISPEEDVVAGMKSYLLNVSKKTISNICFKKDNFQYMFHLSWQSTRVKGNHLKMLEFICQVLCSRMVSCTLQFPESLQNKVWKY